MFDQYIVRKNRLCSHNELLALQIFSHETLAATYALVSFASFSTFRVRSRPFLRVLSGRERSLYQNRGRAGERR